MISKIDKSIKYNEKWTSLFGSQIKFFFLMSSFGAITFLLYEWTKTRYDKQIKKPNQLNIQKAKQHLTERRTYARHIGWDVQTAYKTEKMSKNAILYEKKMTTNAIVNTNQCK